MAEKTLFSVNTIVPSPDIRTISYDSNQTLLDADIILLTPCKEALSSNRVVNSTSRLSSEQSDRAKRQRDHWRKEIFAAATNGKLVIVFLEEPVTAALTDGRGYFDGEICSYDIVPIIRKYSKITGTKIKVTNAASIIRAYWKEFAQFSSYRVEIEGNFSDVLLESEVGNRVVGAINSHESGGAILCLPVIDFRAESFYRKSDKAWTEAGVQAGNRFVSEIVRLAGSLAGDIVTTPPPDWASADAYRISLECDIQGCISQIDEDLTVLQAKRCEREIDLARAAEPRRLLFEKGSPLEDAILDSLKSMGFQATRFRKGESEFDSIFSSPEGERYIGEAEGRDNKAIGIEKLDQLQRNLLEDYDRGEVNEMARGILFENGCRLASPNERNEAFTEKC